MKREIRLRMENLKLPFGKGLHDTHNRYSITNRGRFECDNKESSRSCDASEFNLFNIAGDVRIGRSNTSAHK